MAGTCHGSPAATHALRVTLQPCSPDLRDAATDDVVDDARDRRPSRSTSALQREPSRSLGCQSGQRALALADRRAHRVDDHGFPNLHVFPSATANLTGVSTYDPGMDRADLEFVMTIALQRLVDRVGVDPERIDDVVGGCVSQVGEQGCNVTRNSWVAAGLPQSVPCTSVDRQCGSSQQAMHFAAQGVMSGCYDLAIACGAESMTRSPMGWNASGGIGPFSPDFMAACDGQLKTQFEVAQILAERFKISREDMDEFALESHGAAAKVDSGGVADEFVPVPLKDAEGRETGELLEHDEGIRRGGTMESLPRCRRPPPGYRRSPPTSPQATRRRCPTARPRC